MDSDKTVTASFAAIPSYPLIVNISGDGSVAPAGGSYISNTVVSLAATAANGSIFHGWSGDAGGNANPLSLVMNGPRTVNAIFGQPPTISSQPQSLVAQPGDTLAFHATVTGSEPRSYQWYFAGSPLNGATAATYTITNIQLANAGNYRLVVTNLFGRATSEVAVLTVTCPGANVLSACTEAALRAAVDLGGHIRVCCNDTITLTGPIDVAKDTVLDASGQMFGISGNNLVRLFNVAAGVTFVVSNASLANGRVVGANNVGTAGEHVAAGGILNMGGTVKLYTCVLSNNSVQGGNGTTGGNASGGAIHTVGGAVLLDHVLVVSNSVRGGAASGTGAGLSHGGAIYSDNSTVIVENSTLLGNSCTTPNNPTGPARGGMLFQLGGASYFTNSTIEGNRAAAEAGVFDSPNRYPGHAEGAGVFVLGGNIIVDRSVLSRNVAQGGFAPRSDAGRANGGGIYAAGNTAILRSSLMENTAIGGLGGTGGAVAQGGAFYNVGTVTILATSIHSNSASGGIGGGWGTPFGWGGSAALGGGVFNGGTAFVTNCTISQNIALGGRGASGGVSAGDAHGGGIYSTGVVAMLNTTIASNTIGTGLGYTSFVAGANVAMANGSFTVRNTIIAYPGTNANVWGTLTDAGYNISSDSSAAFGSGTSFNFTDPKLLPLAPNGGPTLTMALDANSPALDWAPTEGAPSTDQRGEARPYGSGVDLGAFELAAPWPTLSCALNGSMFEITFTVSSGQSYELQRSDDLNSWETLETITTEGTIVRSFPRSAPRDFYRLRSATR